MKNEKYIINCLLLAASLSTQPDVTTNVLGFDPPNSVWLGGGVIIMQDWKMDPWDYDAIMDSDPGGRVLAAEAEATGETQQNLN